MNLNLIRRFIFSSPAKQINALLLFISYYLNRLKPWGMPIRLMIEPANFCNLRCPTCPTGNGTITKAKRLLSLNEFKQIIDETGKRLYHLTLWNWGEPFLNPSLSEMIKYARKSKIYVVVSTNGHFLNETTSKSIVASGLNRLIIALDGLSQETLTKYRVGSSYEKVLTGIKNIVQAKKDSPGSKLEIELQFILMKHNEGDLPKVKQFAQNMGFDKVVIKTFGSHLNWWKLQDFEPTDKRWSRYRREIKPTKSCKSIWLGMNINSDGNVVPCCYDPFEKHILGNVFRDGGVRAIWLGEKFRNFRQSILWGKPLIDICRNCEYNVNISKHINLK